MKKETFEQQIDKHTAILEQQHRIFKIIGLIKLLHVLFVGFIIYFIFTGEASTTTLMVSGIVAVVLVLFWLYHEQLKKKINYSKGMIVINQRHLDRISGRWSQFADMGFEFVNHDHPYASDLDMVGKKSVFQFLNSTHTWHGRQKFADDLLKVNYANDEIILRQAAITELSEDVVFASHIEYQYAQIGVHAADKWIVKRLENKASFMKHDFLKGLIIYGPLVTLSLAGFAFLTGLSALYPVVAILAICQLLGWGLSFFKTSSYLADALHLSDHLDAYSAVIHELQSRPFKSDKLREIQKCLVNAESSVAIAIKELAQIANRAKLRRNGLVWMVLNMTLLWDLITAFRFEAWKRQYALRAESWFMSLGEFESLLSFSHLPNVTTLTCIPTIVNYQTVEAKQLGHPLITNEQRVSNDVRCQNHIFIISGSNMSGKTTFMRTVGINLILARTGSFVCGAKMNFSPLAIMTSMRIADDLSEGISTFYAELKRIKGMIEMAKQTSQMMFLIDEVFRGTNSVDRLIGAKTILKKLDALGVVGMITTHDLDLCELANDHPRVRNYSFLERYTDHAIHFDYQIKEGVSTTTNAVYLMKMMDIM